MDWETHWARSIVGVAVGRVGLTLGVSLICWVGVEVNATVAVEVELGSGVAVGHTAHVAEGVRTKFW